VPTRSIFFRFVASLMLVLLSGCSALFLMESLEDVQQSSTDQLMVNARKQLEAKDYAKAIDSLKQVLLLSRQQREAHFDLAKTYAQSGDLARADEALVAAGLALSHDADYYTRLGYHYQHVKRLDQATMAFQQGLELSPNDYTLQHALARHYYLQKNFAAAKDLTLKLLAPADKSQPDSELLEDMGFILTGLKEYESAKGYFEQAIQRDPSRPRAYFGLGEYYLLRSNAPEAEKHLSLAEARGYDQPDTLGYLFLSY
jgi:Flp pilus assembly protein TadD